jgi:hypothetical protein
MHPLQVLGDHCVKFFFSGHECTRMDTNTPFLQNSIEENKKPCYGGRHKITLSNRIVYRMTHKSLLLLSAFSVLALTACGASMNKELDENARYWQRKDTTDAIYQQGPKAQQMLFQDIASCTAHINELQRLGAIREAVPPETFDSHGNPINPDSPEGRLGNWDTPKREGYMRTEYYDYTDFEGCMDNKGWERTKYNNYKTVDRARDTYLDTIGVERYRAATLSKTKARSYNP